MNDFLVSIAWKIRFCGYIDQIRVFNVYQLKCCSWYHRWYLSDISRSWYMLRLEHSWSIPYPAAVKTALQMLLETFLKFSFLKIHNFVAILSVFEAQCFQTNTAAVAIHLVRTSPLRAHDRMTLVFLKLIVLLIVNHDSYSDFANSGKILCFIQQNNLL